MAREDIAVVVSQQKGFVDSLNLDEIRTIWRRTSPATTWDDVDPRLPAIPIEPVGWKPDTPPATLLAQGLFGPVDPLVRDDYEVAGDSKELTKAVASSPYATGYLPLPQVKPRSGVRPVRVLSRPLYLDVSADSRREPEVRRFVREYLRDPPATRPSDGAVEARSSHPVYGKFTRP